MNRKEQKEQTRRKVLDAAMKLFAERGITSTRTAEIAVVAGVSHGSLFAHFATRDALISAVIEEVTGDIAAAIHDMVDSEGASVRDVLRAHLDGIAGRELLYARLVMEGPILPALARATMVGLQSAISHHLQRAANREQDAGALRRIDLPLLFNTWLGLVNHYVSNRDLFAPGGSVVAAYGDQLLEHYLSLLAPRQER